jgi:4-phospho-D-threonate 3-dehydrogenase / 4-phospho-D-erythronate 3-dehydrogenase
MTTGGRSLAITMGDPSGVGPEVVVKALSATLPPLRYVVAGSAERLRLAAQRCGLDVEVRTVTSIDDVPALHQARQIACIDIGVPTERIPFGEVSAGGGEAAYRAIEIATRLAQRGDVQGIVTAPLNKEALHAAGHVFPGHTELLAHLSSVPEVSMMLTAPGLRVIHVTTHMGLRHAIDRIEPGLVERTIRRGHDALIRAGIPKPRIAVCGINPHAGENGLFGSGEEAEKIVPAIERCRAANLAVEGPLPADTLFFRARRGDYDLVVAMYHDQGHGPVKVLGLEAGVNVTIGLPFVRTSVDHGTAFDIAGTGRADERSLIEAIVQAIALLPPGRAQ